MKKAFDQTVRDLKREVNKKVLKVPGIEQKVLDATSNEPWGPQGSHLAEIAEASQNNHEYQMILNVIWKRLTDTGKNWRHVYKALTVLEFLVVHGSDRVIDEIMEHSQQIMSLSSFQYTDSSGRDMGLNVRRKYQSLLSLVNDREKVQSIRRKVIASRDRCRRDGDRQRRYSDGCIMSESWGNDDFSAQSSDDNQYVPRNRMAADREAYRSLAEHDRYLTRAPECKNGEPSIGPPPSYEEATKTANEHSDERNGEPAQESTQNLTSSPSPKAAASSTECIESTVATQESTAFDPYDEFNPRRSTSDTPAVCTEIDMLWSLSESDATDPHVSMTDVLTPINSEADEKMGFDTSIKATSSVTSTVVNQPGENPFGDPPFYATPEAILAQPQNLSALQSFSSVDDIASLLVPAPGFDAAGYQLGGISYNTSSTASNQNPEFPPSDFLASPSTSDILDEILPRTAPPVLVSTLAAQIPAPSPTNLQEAPINPLLETGFSVPFDQNVAQHFPDPTQIQTLQTNPLQQGFHIPSHSAQIGAEASVLANIPMAQINPTQEYGFSVPFDQKAVQHLPAPTSTETVETNPLLRGLHMPSSSAQIGAQPSALANIPTAQMNSFQKCGFSVPFVQNTTHQLSASTSIQTVQMNPLQQGLHIPSPSAQIGAQPSAQVNLVQPSGFSAPFDQNAARHLSAPKSIHTMQMNPLQQGLHMPSPSCQIGTGPSAIASIPTAQMNTVQVSGFSVPFDQNATRNLSAQTSVQTVQMNPLQQGLHIPSPSSQIGTQPSSQASAAVIGAATKSQPVKDKFGTKSAVWADSLSRGLVDLDLAGHKTNPLANIGIDFDTIHRKEKREVKNSAAPTTPATAATAMGKAMGAGSGLGRAGFAGSMHQPPWFVGSGPNMGFGMGMNNYRPMSIVVQEGAPASIQAPVTTTSMPSGLPNMPSYMMGMNGYAQQQPP